MISLVVSENDSKRCSTKNKRNACLKWARQNVLGK